MRCAQSETFATHALPKPILFAGRTQVEKSYDVETDRPLSLRDATIEGVPHVADFCRGEMWRLIIYGLMNTEMTLC